MKIGPWRSVLLKSIHTSHYLLCWHLILWLYLFLHQHELHEAEECRVVCAETRLIFLICIVYSVRVCLVREMKEKGRIFFMSKNLQGRKKNEGFKICILYFLFL